MKKAELSINMIILVVIALVILVIVIFLITRTSTNYGDATACNSRGGVCKPGSGCELGVFPLTGDLGRTICPAGQVCCPPLS